MKLSLRHIVWYACLITLVCLGQVFLQVEIFAVGYRLRDKEKRFSELIDQQRVLIYNNTCLKAPQYLAAKLIEHELEMDVPDTAAVSNMHVTQRPAHYAQTP